MGTPREASAADSAARAETAAQAAAGSADQAMRSAAEAAVSALLLVELAPIRQALADLHTAIATINAKDAEQDQQELADQAALTGLQKVVLAFQSQSLWMAAALLLVGAALGVFVNDVVFG